MATMYQIQQLSIPTDGTNAPDLDARPTVSVICESYDHEMILCHFASYCSGLNDYEEPHYYASFSAHPASFYRIVAVEEY